MLAIGQIMQTRVMTISPTATLGETAELLCKHGVSGLPVVDAENRLVGVISEFALMDLLFEPRLREKLVADYMTTQVRTLSTTDSLTRAVHMFALYRVRRLPVVEEGRLVGLVSRRDLLLAASKLEGPLEEPLEQLMPELFGADAEAIY
ncbi:MAG: CBS domain-containing protein [Planctomycetales bacterium]|nr:CBS domain-containing protein [Planctomycetales bacterium]